MTGDVGSWDIQSSHQVTDGFCVSLAAIRVVVRTFAFAKSRKIRDDYAKVPSQSRNHWQPLSMVHQETVDENQRRPTSGFEVSYAYTTEQKIVGTEFGGIVHVATLCACATTRNGTRNPDVQLPSSSGLSPAAASNCLSSSVPGLGVVKSFSP
jgi:hypothetical protein